MKNYMYYISDCIKDITIEPKENKVQIIKYDFKEKKSNFITDYQIKGDQIIVYYADGSIHKYSNNEENINILEHQLMLQVEQISKLYQYNVIPSRPFYKREIIITVSALVFYHLFDSARFEQIYNSLRINPNMSYQIALIMMTIGIVFVPKITGLIEDEEIKSYAAKIDYYYQHHDQLNQYFNKNINETINEVEQSKLKRLIKIVKEMEK